MLLPKRSLYIEDGKFDWLGFLADLATDFMVFTIKCFIFVSVVSSVVGAVIQITIKNICPLVK